MFLQIKLKHQDQNSQRFLWRDLHTHRGQEIYCMTRVTFGDTPSPFLSIATVQKHAKHHEKDHPTAAKEVNENMHVDDVLTGAPDHDRAVTLRNELCNLLSKVDSNWQNGRQTLRRLWKPLLFVITGTNLRLGWHFLFVIRILESFTSTLPPTARTLVVQPSRRRGLMTLQNWKYSLILISLSSSSVSYFTLISL